MCAGVHVCRCACVHVHVCMCRCACVHVPCVHVCRCACVYVHVHVCMCACACVQQQNSNTNTQTITSLQCVYNYIKRNILKWTTESVPYITCLVKHLYYMMKWHVLIYLLTAFPHTETSTLAGHYHWKVWVDPVAHHRWGVVQRETTQLGPGETPPGCLLVRHHQVVC